MSVPRHRWLEPNLSPRSPSPIAVSLLDSSSPRSSDIDEFGCLDAWSPPVSITESDENKELVALPLEIWNHIIAWADPATLASLSRVNTVAYHISMKHLYSSISLPKMSDSTKLLETLSSPHAREFTTCLRSLDIPINASNCKAINGVLKPLRQLNILKLKVTGHVDWPFEGTNLDLCQFHWEVLQDRSATHNQVEHGGGPQGLSDWLRTQTNITKLKLVTHERVSVHPDALRKLTRASGPMFIVSNLVPGRPVDTVQVTPRTRDPCVGLRSFGLSTGPLKHLKIVSRVDVDHRRLLQILSQSTPSLETLSFEICGQLDHMKSFLEKSLLRFPPFPELQSLSFNTRTQSPSTPLDSTYYQMTTEMVKKGCPKLHRVFFLGIMATLQPCPQSSRRTRVG